MRSNSARALIVSMKSARSSGDAFSLADQAVTHWLSWPKTYGLEAVMACAAQCASLSTTTPSTMSATPRKRISEAGSP